jgi:hypothetical protein
MSLSCMMALIEAIIFKKPVPRSLFLSADCIWVIDGREVFCNYEASGVQQFSRVHIAMLFPDFQVQRHA